MQGSKIRDSVISVAIRTRGPCSMKALSDVLRRKDRDSRKMCAILLQIPSDPEKMACSALLPLPLCFSYKIAINKMSKLRDLPLLLGCGYSTQVLKLCRGHCAESLIPTQVVEVLHMLVFKLLNFPVSHLQAGAPCPGLQRPLAEKRRVCVSVCAQQTHEPGEPCSAYAGTNCIL